MKKIIACLLIFVGISANAAMYEAEKGSPWHLIGGLGWTNFQQMTGADGQTIFKRIGMGIDLLSWNDTLAGSTHFGVEIAAQDGNSMSPDFTQAQLNQLGGPAVNATVKPIFDLLITGSRPFRTFETPWIYGTTKTWLRDISLLIKAGIAYRQMEFDRNTIPGINRVNGEFQAGISQKVSEKASLGIVYQGIYAPKMVLYTSGPQFGATGTIGEIPIQQGILVTLSVNV